MNRIESMNLFETGPIVRCFSFYFFLFKTPLFSSLLLVIDVYRMVNYLANNETFFMIYSLTLFLCLPSKISFYLFVTLTKNITTCIMQDYPFFGNLPFALQVSFGFSFYKYVPMCFCVFPEYCL